MYKRQVYKVQKSLAPVPENGSVPTDNFDKFQYMLFHPCVVYADVETCFEVDEHNTQRGPKTILLGQNAYVLSVGYTAVGRDGLEIPVEHDACIHNGIDPMGKFLISMLRLYNSYYKVTQNGKKVTMTAANKIEFNGASKCYLCGCNFDVDNTKVLEHCHLSGNFRGAACGTCNRKAKLPHNIIIFFHNGGGFDFHFVIRAISALQGGPLGDMTVHELCTGEIVEEMKLKVRDMRINVVSKSSEKYMEIRFGPLVFRDSILFVKAGLEK